MVLWDHNEYELITIDLINYIIANNSLWIKWLNDINYVLTSKDDKISRNGR